MDNYNGLVQNLHEKIDEVFNTAQAPRFGQTILEEILDDPKQIVINNEAGGLEIYASDGIGAYYRKNGTFRGFIEYGHK